MPMTSKHWRDLLLIAAAVVARAEASFIAARRSFSTVIR